MVVCSAMEYFPGSFLGLLMLFYVGAMLLMTLMSGTSFYHLYYKANFSKWQYKSNQAFPKPSYVRQEILKTCSGCFFAAFFPCIGMYFQGHGSLKGYCGLQETSYLGMLGQFLIIVFVTDVFEMVYHYCGHKFEACWAIHRHHHKFYNPTPFAVIADEAMDNICRSSPMLFLQILMPINLDILYLTFAAFFYGYGVYLHSGYEADWIVASDHPIVNTSFQHYVHHSAATRTKPYHTGFFVKTWDQLAGSCYDGEDKCAKVQREEGKRNKEAWASNLKQFPDYNLLTKPSFYWNPEGFQQTIDQSGQAWRFE